MIPGSAVTSDREVTLDREEARGRARDELADPGYAAAEPSWPERALSWVQERVNSLFDSVSGVAPGGVWAAVVLVALLALAVALVLRRTGGYRRGARSVPLLGATPVRSADEYRRTAETAATEGRYADAIRERLRAVARDLETRGVLAPQPGRTADELARQGGAAIPTAAEALRAASRVFDDVWYGQHPADATAYATVRQADETVRAARPALPVGTR